MDTLGMPAWVGAWKKQHGRSKRSELDRRIGRKIEAAASKIAELAAQEPDRQRRRRPKLTGVAMTEQDGAEKRKTLRELLAALLDALKDALLALQPDTLFVTDAETIRGCVSRLFLSGHLRSPNSVARRTKRTCGNRHCRKGLVFARRRGYCLVGRR